MHQIGDRSIKLTAGVALAIAALLATAIVMLTGNGPLADAVKPVGNLRGVNINGTYVNDVLFNGHLMSVGQYRTAAAAADAAGQDRYEYFDTKSASAGYILATTDEAQMVKWIGSDPSTWTGGKGTPTGADLKVTSSAYAAPVTCHWQYGANVSAAWTDAQCGENHEIMPPGQNKASVIYNDSYSSIELGCKTSGVTVYQNGSYGGGYKYFGNSGSQTGYTNMATYTFNNGTNINDRISSYKTAASGASC